jgi:short subunit dehydrogenase-like uncharacterized protein
MSKQDKSRTDITVYGATGCVGLYICQYLLAASDANEQSIRLVLGGRNKAKLEKRMESLESKNGSTMEVFVADSSDLAALTKMAEQTKVIVACAGPFQHSGTNVVAACANTGTDYVDITGEFFWVAKMRQQFSEAAKKSGARIIPLCGFDSVPSDISVLAAVEALREVRGGDVEIETGTSWHIPGGAANAGTVHSALDIPVDVKSMFLNSSGKLRKVPFLVEDPLCLAHPTNVRHNPEYDGIRNAQAAAEWWNQLPCFDSVLGYAMSLSFFMAPVNAKVVNASSVALNYGPNFTYRERWAFLGFRIMRAMGIISAIPAIMIQFMIGVFAALVKFPYLGKKLIDTFYPPGLGVPDFINRACSCEVYTEVTSKAGAPTRDRNIDRAACHIYFEGDAANIVTSQCVGESALALIHNRSDLPKRSEDGFGTPAELIGMVLLKRFKENKVRKVGIETKVEKDAPRLSLKLLV